MLSTTRACSQYSCSNKPYLTDEDTPFFLLCLQLFHVFLHPNCRPLDVGGVSCQLGIDIEINLRSLGEIRDQFVREML